MDKTNKAFTMMEIIVVIVIIGILAGFGIPKYTRAIDRAKERDAATNLRIIRSALILYQQQDGAFPAVGFLGTIGAINNTLGLAIIENNITYTCVAAAGLRCRAAVTGGAWELYIDDPFTAEPYCGVPTCPTL